ncbi:putative quinol monooxygenase [Roseomonas sp. CAU 1739]|uniref:putative quinol monooxygenase n=1 Tax=Roseomonas sp. CAU 1739 TaxID=3140364 RepID=UPI00325C09B6
MTEQDQEVRVLATARLRPDAQADFTTVAATFVVASRQEEGCIAYDMLASVTDPCALATIERWTSRGAAIAHLGAPHTQAFLAALAMASDGTPPSITLLSGRAETLA